MKGKSFILSIFLLCFTFMCLVGKNNQKLVDLIKPADELRIEYVKGKVQINGAERGRGYIFKANQEINISNNGAIKVTHIKSGRGGIAITPNILREVKRKTAHAFIQKRQCVSKGSGNLKKMLSAYPWTMVNDTLNVETGMLLDDYHGFILFKMPENKALSSPVQYYEGTDIIGLTKEYFQTEGIILEEDKKYRFRVVYVEGNNSKEITDKFIIEYIKP